MSWVSHCESRVTRRVVFLFFAVLLPLLWLACTASTPTTKPSLESVLPKQGFENTEITLTIRGKFPEKIEKIQLLGVNQTAVVLQDVKRIDSVTLSAKVPAQSPPGLYDLQVLIGGSEPLVLGGAFEIRPHAFYIYFIDVDQGDATLLVSPTGTTMLIDAGKEANVAEINRLLRELKIGQLDHILATHYDQDHVEGFGMVLKGPDGKLGTDDDHTPRKKIWDRGGSVKNRTYLDIRQEMRKRSPSLYQVLPGDTLESFPNIDLGGGVKVQVVTVNGKILGKDKKIHTVDCQGEENCYSIGTLVTFGKFRFWTGGDLTGGGISTPDLESKLAEHLDPVDVYRVHHHGSRTSSNSTFIKAIKPQVVVISMGKQNSFCHPHTEVMRNISQYAKAAFLLTTPALAGNSSQCSNSPNTQSFLGSLGAKAFVNLGTFHLEVSETQFTLRGLNAPANETWKVR